MSFLRQTFVLATALLVPLAARADTTPPSNAPASTATPPPATNWKPGPVPLAPVPTDETPKPGLKIPGMSLNGLPGQGFTIATQDGRYSLNLRLRLQLRDTAQEQGHVWQNQINIHTVRLIASGHLLSPKIGYYLQLAFGQGDFEATSQGAINTPSAPTATAPGKQLNIPVTTTTTNPSPILDAFVEFTYLRDLNVRVGQFFVPFDRARTIRESALQFVDRPQMVNELALNRGDGIRLFSEDLGGLNGLLGYSLGVFGADGMNNFNFATPGFLYVARLQIKPFGLFDDDVEGDLSRVKKPRLAIGGGFAYNDHTDRTKSEFGNFYPAGTVSYIQGAADLVFKYGGFSLLSEFLYRDGDPTEFTYTLKNSYGSATTPEYARNAWGYLIQGGFMFTDFFEVTGRFDQLLPVVNGTYSGKIPQTVDDPTLYSTTNNNGLINNQGREAGGGINFYLNNHALKLQTDYFHYWGWSEALQRDQIRVQIDVTI